MDPNVTQLISNVGFPIVAFLLMYQLTTKSLEEIRTALVELKVALVQLGQGGKG